MNKKAICIISVLIILLGIETTYIIMDVMKDKNPVVADDEPREEDKSKEIITYQVTSLNALEYEADYSNYHINSLEELEKFYDLYEEIDELNKNKDLINNDYTAFIQVVKFNTTDGTTLDSVTVDDNKVTFHIDRKMDGIGQSVLGRYYFIALIPNEKVADLDITGWMLPSGVLVNKFALDSVNKYIVTTNMRFLTMQNDGGSHTDIYYQIDLEENKVTKVLESYKANLGGTPEVSRKEWGAFMIPTELANEIRTVLNDALTKEDINEPVNYSFFTIETFNNEKSIYNQETINTLNNLLNKIDNLTT